MCTLAQSGETFFHCSLCMGFCYTQQLLCPILEENTPRKRVGKMGQSLWNICWSSRGNLTGLVWKTAVTLMVDKVECKWGNQCEVYSVQKVNGADTAMFSLGPSSHLVVTIPHRSCDTLLCIYTRLNKDVRIKMCFMNQIWYWVGTWLYFLYGCCQLACWTWCYAC